MREIGEGRHHSVFENGTDSVIKIPKDGVPISHTEALRSLEFFRRNFAGYIPETSIEKDADCWYRVIQRRIDWILLGDFLQNHPMPDSVRNSLTHFLHRVLKILLQEGKWFDIIGTPPNPALKFQWEWCTNFLIDGDQNLWFIDTIVNTKLLKYPSYINKIFYRATYQKRLNQALSLLSALGEK